jgi:hypothetical protein
MFPLQQHIQLLSDIHLHRLHLQTLNRRHHHQQQQDIQRLEEDWQEYCQQPNSLRRRLCKTKHNH